MAWGSGAGPDRAPGPRPRAPRPEKKEKRGTAKEGKLHNLSMGCVVPEAFPGRASEVGAIFVLGFLGAAMVVVKNSFRK